LFRNNQAERKTYGRYEPFAKEPGAPFTPEQANGWILLILIGSGLAVSYWLNLVWIPVWLVGLALLILGTIERNRRLIVPGGIITGTGLAILVQTSPWVTILGNQACTGIFIICLGLGWLLIPLFTRLAALKTTLWPIIPGSILVATGIAYWESNGWVKVLTSLVWPVSMMIIGLFLIIQWNRKK
jgi:hypothetical protein